MVKGKFIFEDEEKIEIKDAVWYRLDCLSFGIWLATACDTIAIALYRILCGSKNTEHLDWGVPARSNQWAKFYRNSTGDYLI